MGKPDGFFEYDRQEMKNHTPSERIKNWDEFYICHDSEIMNNQAARCMNCGVPFCHSGIETDNKTIGCPLNNLIPEWNDLLYRGDISQAYEREVFTNNFPEFTGRVCPALCEFACNANLYNSAVTIKDIEKYIAERMFSENRIKPYIPQQRTGKNIAVVGSGPAGLACADILNRIGHNVTVFERNDRPGGLLMYGIPNMKLDKKIVQRRIALMKEEGIKFITCCDITENTTILKDFNAVSICVGATKPKTVDIEGINLNGVYYAMEFLERNTKSMLDSGFKDKKYIDVKNKNVVILGGGDTASDCVATSIRHKCKSVVQLEIMAEPQSINQKDLWPFFYRSDKKDYAREEALYVFGKDIKMYSKLVKKIEDDGNGNVKRVLIKDVLWNSNCFTEIEGTDEIIDCDVFIIAIGFSGPERELIDKLGIVTDEKSNIAVNKKTHMTNIEGVFAAGDCCRGQSLVVWAIRQGRETAFAIDKYLKEKG